MHTRISYLIALATTISVLSNCGGKVNQQATAPAEKIAAQARADAPMPPNGFKATITLPEPPTSLQPGQKIQLLVKVRNISDVTWPAHGRAADGFYQVNLGNNWYDEKNVRLVNHPYVRSGLPGDLRPGDQAEISLNITAPATAGNYTLQLDLVQEMVAWFSEKGSAAPKFKVTVGP